MTRLKYEFSSESVTAGHPDKVCDQVSDAVLDAVLAQDKMGRVAVETAVKDKFLLVFGEVTTKPKLSNDRIEQIARQTLHEIGYGDPRYGFPADKVDIQIRLGEQSEEIRDGVNRNAGAGDQGMMFGMAVNETPNLMPLPITLAHNLTRKLSELRANGALPYLGPDGKSQVSVEYNGGPEKVLAVVLSNQHDADAEQKRIKVDFVEQVIKPVLGAWWNPTIALHINPSGRFVEGGPQADAGLTGRKIIVDTYGGWARHGGGAFSGKDPTKVDRSGAYMARYVAKNIVAAGLAHHVEVQIAYAIGVAEPVSLLVNSFGTGKITDLEITRLIKKVFDLRPAAIIERLDLRRPIYRQTAAYGHFGRDDLDLPWEKTDAGNELKQA